tara:strand:- start:2217 stop:2621 length:405 start_codon:yes stop_codon:yes gene_type:complete
MRINKNIVFKKLSVEEVKELYGVKSFKKPEKGFVDDILLNNENLTVDISLEEMYIDEPKELKGQPVKRIYLEKVKEKMKDKKEASFKINGSHVCITIDEETEIMVYNLEQRGTIFFRSESDTHFWEKQISKDKK